MKTKIFPSNHRLATLLVAAITLWANGAFAQPYYYDNLAGAGFGTAGGTWSSAGNTGIPGWNTDSTGAATPGTVTTGTGDALNFGSVVGVTTNALAAGTVTVSGTVSAGTLSYGGGSGAIVLSGGTLNLGATAGITNNTANTQALNTQISGAGTSLTLSGGSFSFNSASANNTSGDLYINLLAGKSATFNAANASWGSGKNCYITGGLVTLANSSALGGSGGFTINLGDTSVNNNATTLNVQGTSVNVANTLTVVSGLTGTATLGCANNSVTYSGNITANDNLTILENQSGGSFAISGTASTIANGKTVTFSDTGSVTLTDSAIWGGLGSIAYGGTSSGSITISGAKTHSGGTTLGAMSGAGIIAATTGSAGSANAPTSGSFGTGTLSLGATKVRTTTGADTTFHNSITFIGDPTFVNVASEKSMIFTGDAGLNGANRTITANIGNSVSGKYVEFQGVISGSGYGITLQSAGANGALRLSGANTYSGPTVVSSGLLLISNSLALQNSALDTLNSIVGTTSAGIRAQVPTLTLGGLTGNKNLASVFSTTSGGYGSVTNMTLNPGTGATPSYSGIIANGASGMTLTKSGNGTQTLTGANTYTGNTAISGGTLALGVGGSISNSANISIAAGATFDVSALTTFSLSSSTTLSASGTGTSAGTQATITGGTTVSLGSQGITLTYAGTSGTTDTTHPSLVISQGALSLNNNTFTINGASQLANGVYTLIKVTGGTITQNGSPAYTVGGTAIDGTKQNVISVSGGSVILTVSPLIVANDANLTSLVLNPAGTLSPSFLNSIISYTSSEAAGVTPTVTAVTAQPTATLQLIVNGGTPTSLTSGVASSPLTLTMGAVNTITVTVTAPDTTTVKSYTVSVTVPSAAPYYWDGDDVTAGFGSASGTWAAPTAGTATSGWSTDSTGATTVNGNSVLTGAGDAVNFGTASAGLTAGTIAVSGTVSANSLTFGSASEAITLSGGIISLGTASPNITPNNATNTINSAITLSAATTIYSPAPSSGILTLGGAISGNQNMTFGGLNTGGASQKIVLNAASTYTGSTSITTAGNSGANNIVQLGIDNALPTNTTVNLGGFNGSSSSARWTRLDLNGYNQTLAGITISTILYRQLGIINSSATLGTLTVNVASGADTFTGQIGYYGGTSVNGAGTGGSPSYLGLTKNGAGKLTLNPALFNLCYTGPTTVNQGVLEYAGGANLVYTNGNVYPGAISIASGAGLLFSGTANNILGGAISGSGSLTNTGTGTVTLTNANSFFTGTISVRGTDVSANAILALDASGEIGGATLVIGTNATFDVSAQTTYTLGSSAALKASGKGTSAVTQATIKGGTTVSLGAQPITLTWGGPTSGSQTANPCLVISQGALTLNNNPFTINGSTLGVGTYRLIQVGDGSTGTINQNVSPSYAVTGTAIDGTKNNVISGDGSGNLILTVTAGPSGPATITNSVSGSTLSLSWPAGQGWRLQAQTNSLSVGISTNWSYITDGSVSSTNITVDATKPTVFYRLTYP